MGSPKQFVLGYGSLLNLESAGKTLGRLVRPEDVVPVEVEDHLRLWNLVAPVQLIERGNEWVNAVFLDLQPRPGYRANGILIEVSPAELDNLDIREQNYTRLDISAKTADRPDHGTVFAYVGKPEFFAACFEHTAILGRYVEIVEVGLRTWGQRFTDRYQETTQAHDFSIVDGPYRFSDPKQNLLTGRD